MKYLIRGWWVELEAHLPPERFEQVRDREVLPAIEMLSQWEEEGKIYGGVLRGEKAGTWVIEAESSEEVGRLLGSLPSWGAINWLARPLEPTRSMGEREWELGERPRTTFETFRI